jgi:hypothetical protein
MPIVCPTLAHIASKILSGTIYLEVRAIGAADISDVDVRNCIDKPYHLLKRSDVGVTPSLELIIEESLKIEFTENTAFYCVFCYPSRGAHPDSLVYIPAWFPQVMFATAGQSVEIASRHNVIASQIKIQLPEVKLSKFDIMMPM